MGGFQGTIKMSSGLSLERTLIIEKELGFFFFFVLTGQRSGRCPFSYQFYLASMKSEDD